MNCLAVLVNILQILLIGKIPAFPIVKVVEKKKTGYYSNEQIAIEEIDGVLEKGKEFIKLVQGKSAIHCQIFSFSGWINGAGLVDKGQRGVAALFFITGALFLLLALCELYLLRKVIASCTKAIANAHFTL